MSNGDDRLIGEIHAMAKAQGENIQRQGADITQLFRMVSEMREGRCPQGMALGQRIDAMETGVRRLWVWLILSAAGGAGGGVGIQKALSMFFGAE